MWKTLFLTLSMFSKSQVFPVRKSIACFCDRKCSYWPHASAVSNFFFTFMQVICAKKLASLILQEFMANIVSRDHFMLLIAQPDLEVRFVSYNSSNDCY